jgi:hypothetical protein
LPIIAQAVAAVKAFDHNAGWLPGKPSWTAGGGSAEFRIYIFLKDLRALLGDVLAQFVELHFASLI